MSYDPTRHHRRSIRLRDYDYSSAGAYFVTIVVKDRECLLGEIVDDDMRLSEIGEVVGDFWDSLPERFPGIELDGFVIMPNHIHGIIVITPEADAGCVGDGMAVATVGAVHEPPLRHPPNLPSPPACGPATVGAVHEPPLRRPPPPDPASMLERRRMLLPKIIGYFKMNSAKRANDIRSMRGAPFWQRNYYEHVVRNAADLERLREYIACNPLKWALDQVNPAIPSNW